MENKILLTNSEKDKPLGTRRYGWEGTVTMDLKEAGSRFFYL